MERFGLLKDVKVLAHKHVGTYHLLIKNKETNKQQINKNPPNKPTTHTHTPATMQNKSIIKMCFLQLVFSSSSQNSAF